jgi:hypothetical protein
MKTFITLIGSFLLLTGSAISQESSTVLFENIYLTPKTEHISQFEKNIIDHNKRFHGEGDHSAFVQYVVTGRRSGDYVWAMGPCTFADLDTRPAGDDHANDWANTVMTYVEDASPTEYWERDDEIFYAPEGYSGDKLRIRFHRYATGKGGQVSDLFAKIQKVYQAKKYERTFSLYWNRFPTARGRNIATVNGFKNWAMYDEDSNFSADFNEVHGEGSFAKWLDELRSVVEWTDNEIRQLITE